MNNIFAKSLAPALGYPEKEVARWLEVVFQKIAEELVLNGEVRLAKLGVLQRVHVPSEPREVNGKLMLMPPHYEIKLNRTAVSEDSLIFDVSIEQLQLQEEVAQKFAKGFARVVEKVVEVHGSLQMGELGEFIRTERNEVMFKQSPTFSNILDKPFVGLLPVIISERHESTPAAQTPSQEVANQPIYTESKTTHAPEPLVAANKSVAELSPSDASFLKSPTLSPIDEPSLPSMASSESKNSLFEEGDKSSFSDTSITPAKREPLFVALAAAARALPESEDEREMARRKAINATDENGKPFQYEAAVPTKAAYKPSFDDAPSAPVPSSTQDPSTWADDEPDDKEAPVLRNIAIATAIVFFTIIIAFIVMKYESISFTPPAPPAPVDRAKIESEKAAAARAEAERILAEKSIPKKPARMDSSKIKADGMLLKNITKAAKDLPTELTTIDLSKGGYTIIVASQPTFEKASMIVEEFGKLGLAATVMEKQVGKAIRYRVRVGQFPTAAEANAAKKKYKSIIPSDAFLDKLSEPSR
jgi:nucleoid DNA-binding protein